MSRVVKIYQELYGGSKKKSYLAEKLNVTTKTIENTIAKYSEDIILDKTIGGYRFKTLLPSKIPSNVFFDFFKDSVENQVIKNDFLTLAKAISSQENISVPVIPTENLSSFAQKVISLNIAVNTNCTLEMSYFGGRGELELKYIKPHQIFVDKAKYYLYANYIEENNKDIGEYRTFALNGISDVKPLQYIKDGNFKTNKILNAYGEITKEKYATLILTSYAANFFKREGLFARDNFDFLMENADGSVTIKMYYNDINEIVSLIQQWMPFIKVKGELANDVDKVVQENFYKFATKDK